ncbi:MAG: hypothetical protein U0269_37875 [Polyangiales bacterium]
MQSRASLLALAASLEATAAELSAKAATIRASVEATENQAPSATVTLEEHMRRTGQSKRKARETFAAFERAGFRVVRLGHAVSMDAGEYARAVEAIASKRSAVSSAPSAPTNSTAADDESPAAIMARAGFVPTRPHQHQKGTRPKRAA